MIKKILIIMSLFFVSFITSFADWKEDIDNYIKTNFATTFPNEINLFDFKSSYLNDNWELVVVYDLDIFNSINAKFKSTDLLWIEIENNNSNYNLNYFITYTDTEVYITLSKFWITKFYTLENRENLKNKNIYILYKTLSFNNNLNLFHDKNNNYLFLQKLLSNDIEWIKNLISNSNSFQFKIIWDTIFVPDSNLFLHWNMLNKFSIKEYLYNKYSDNIITSDLIYGVESRLNYNIELEELKLNNLDSSNLLYFNLETEFPKFTKYFEDRYYYSLLINNFVQFWIQENYFDYFNNNLQTNSEINNHNLNNYDLYSRKYPNKININWFENIAINDNWEIVIEYSKDQYDKIIDTYWWKDILIFDPENNQKNKHLTETIIKWNSVFITVLKNNLNNAIDYFLTCKDYDNCYYNSFDWYNDFFWQKYIYKESNIIKFLVDINNSDYENINIYYENEKERIENWVWIIWNNIVFDSNLYSSIYQNEIHIDYINKKYKKYINIENWIVTFIFPLNDNKVILNFLKDEFYYMWLSFLNKWNDENLVIDENDDLLLYLWDEEEKWIFTSDIFQNWINYNFFINFDNWNIEVLFQDNSVSLNSINSDNFIIDNFLNISEVLNYISLKWDLNKFNISNIYNLQYRDLTFNFWYPTYSNIFFPLASQIKSPKNISKNPFLISVNFILALLYLLAFYFTTQLFNSYFEELSTKNKWNAKLSKISIKYTKLPFEILYNYLIKISKEKKIPKLRLYVNKIRNFTIKYEHNIYIILWFLGLWIIGQIVVDDFDILSLKWCFTIIIMMLILAFITVFKDLLLYLYNKKESKEKLKLENIPLGFIFAGIVAISWRWIWLIPWVMFGSVIKLNAKSNITERKTTKPKLLFKILLIVFWVWLLCWLLTIPFDSSSFIYKFLIVTYFGLINDVFFALLPFGMLWGIYILKDKKLKVKWFIFTFIIFFFLLHTIMNSEWDLDKILEFDGNFSVLVWILFFWMLITGGLYYMNNKKIISK